MSLKEIINKYNIKHVFLQDKLNISKAGLYHILNKKCSVERGNQIRLILEDMARGLLLDLQK